MQLFASPRGAIFSRFQFPKLSFDSIPQAVLSVLGRGRQPLRSFFLRSYSPAGGPWAEGEPIPQHVCGGWRNTSFGCVTSLSAGFPSWMFPCCCLLYRQKPLLCFICSRVKLKTKIRIGCWTSHRCLDETSDSSPTLQGWYLA